VEARYSSWNGDLGQRIEAGQMNFHELEKFIMAKGEAAANTSGRQELIENVVNRYMDKV
jgi:xylose isomerase